MDAIVFQKAKNIKSDVAALCVSVRTVYVAFTSKLGDLKAYANSTLQKAQAKDVNKSIIKSVQRGTVTEAGTVTINTVDTSKCLLLVDGGYKLTGLVSSSIAIIGGTEPSISFNSATEIQITNVKEYANWQVIEFY